MALLSWVLSSIMLSIVGALYCISDPKLIVVPENEEPIHRRKDSKTQTLWKKMMVVFILGTFTATAMFDSVCLANKCPSSLSLPSSQCTWAGVGKKGTLSSSL